MPPLAFLYDPHRKQIVFVNHDPAAFFGSHVDMTLAFPFHDLVDEEDATGITAEWRKCLQLADQEQHHFLLPVMRNGLPPVIFQVHASGMTTGNGNGAASTSFVLFTVNKESSAENNERYKKEYAEFIDIAAHDLDAPLRKLGVWVERLTAKYAHDETEEVQGYVQRISTSLVAMRSLLDDLAILSKLSLLPAMNDHCDLNGIVRDVLQELEPQVHEKKAVITCSALPVLKGDKKQYQLVFKNLLDNALKFTQKDIVPRIDITAEPVTAEEKKIYNFPAGTNFFKIEVADNGHGFSPELAGKIFRPFIRLQARSAFPGNGIGLAIVKRIIINHGGIIYVYSTENSGARFIFILPETID